MEYPFFPKGKKQKELRTKKLVEKNSNEDLKNTQFYLITLEDSNGEHQQIRIFRNSDAAEIAFNFCKENNLDYKSMKYIKKNIQKIIETFDEPNHKLFFLDNSYSSIQELDEENLVSENTLIDNEINKEKNGNKNRIKEIKFNNFKNKEKEKENEEKINLINYIDDNYEIKIGNDDFNNNQNYLEENNNKEIQNKNNYINNNNINNEMKYKNKTLTIPENNIELTIKSSSNEINKEKKKDKSKKDEINFIITEHFNNNKSNIEEKNNQIQYFNTTENQIEKQQEQNLFNNIQREQKSKNYLKLDFNSIKAKMKEIKIKNSVLNKKKERNKDNINLDKKVYNKIEKNDKSMNNMNNSNLKKHQLFKDKNNNKKNQNINENILDKYIKNVNKKQNSKNKNNNPNNTKKEEKIKTNKTFIESNKSNINNNKKENLLQKPNRYKNTILYHKPDILNTDITQSKSIMDNNNFKSNEKQYIHSSRLTPKKTNIFIHKKENSNPKLIFKPKKEKIIKLRNILQTNKETFANLLSNIFTQNFNKTKINNIMQNCHNKIEDKTSKFQNNTIKTKNKKRKNSYILQKEIEKHSFELFKSNDTSRNNLDKALKTIVTEANNNKSKKIFEMRKGLNKIFNNFFEQKNNCNNDNNILNTNYIINKRCRIINNKKKKNMSMNLSSYLSSNKKPNKSKKNSLEINLSNTNFNNTYDKLKEKEKIKENKRTLTNKNSGIIFQKNKKNLINIISTRNNKEKNQNFNSPSQLTINNYNTNIKNFRVLNMINSYRTRKKIIEMKNKTGNISSSQKKFNKDDNFNNISNSYSLLINNEKPQGSNDYSLNVLDQYYTINNTINITNNNSLMDNFKNKEKYYQEDKAFSFIKKINKFMDKDNIGIIILNRKQKLNDIFLENNLILNSEQEKLLEKMFEALFEMQKNNNNFELDEYKILINEQNFLKTMKYIYINKLNSNERNIFLSIENDNNCNLTRKKEILDKIKQKNFLNKYTNI